MTPEAIDTIIAAVGREPADRAKLAMRLDQLHPMIRVSRRTKPPSLKRICKALEEAARLVDANPMARSLGPRIAALLDEARHLVDEARHLKTAPKSRQLSWTDYLCGLLLPGLFKEAFGMRATATRGRRGSAYVRFAEAVMKGFGENCERETIIRSLTAVRTRDDHR